MEKYCSTGQSPQRAVAPTEEEEEDVQISLTVHVGQARLEVLLGKGYTLLSAGM
jgi:hypothetical protein